MEELHGDAAFVDDHPEGALPHLLPGHPGQRIAALLPDLGRLAQLLQIVPEQPPPQPDADGGKPAHRHIQRRLEHLPVHRLSQGGRQPEYVAPALPPGGGIDFRRVVQPHPPQLPLPGQIPVEEGAQGNEILPVLLQAVEQIGVPPLRPLDKLADTAALPQRPVQLPGIAEKDLVSARENQRGRHSRQIPQQRGGQGVLRGVGVALREKPQLPFRQRHILFPVPLVAFPVAGQVRPGGDGHNAPGEGKLLLPQVHTQAEAEPASRALAAEADPLRRISLFQQIPVSLGRVLHRRREPVLRGKPVGGAEYPHPTLVRQGGPEPQGVLQSPAGITPAVEVQDHPLPPGVPGQHPGGGKEGKIVPLHPHLGMAGGPHNLAQGILSLAQGFQGAAFQQRLHVRQPLPNHFRG